VRTVQSNGRDGIIYFVQHGFEFHVHALLYFLLRCIYDHQLQGNPLSSHIDLLFSSKGEKIKVKEIKEGTLFTATLTLTLSLKRERERNSGTCDAIPLTV
jgi:hypothetical protein